MGNTIGNLLRKTPGKIFNRQGGIYQIPCKDCDQIYIGETGKDLQTRIKQHQQDFKSHKENNANFIHWLENGHTIDWNAAAMLKQCNQSSKRKVLEAAKIVSSNTYNLNKNPFNLQPSTANILKKIYRIN